MKGRIVMLAAGLALVAGGCQNKKKSTAHSGKATAEKADKQEAQRMGETGENVAEATRDAADATLNETERAQERMFGRGETVPPEPGVDMPAMGTETPDPGDETVTLGEAGHKADAKADEAAKELNEAADEAGATAKNTAEKVEATAENTAKEAKEETSEAVEELEETADAIDGKIVIASVESVNRTDERVRFRIGEDIDEIQLQSGKEIDVSFSDLPLLTGLDRAEALKKLRGAKDVKVKVVGTGDATRIVEIDLPADTDEKHEKGDGTGY